MKKNACLRLVPAVLVLSLCMASGCASSGIRAGRSGALPPSFAEPVSFSDDISRDIVRQTRELMDLKFRDYLVGADDVLEISIFEWEMSDETKTIAFRVSESGIIALPSVGNVEVAGKTVQEIKEHIEKEFAGKNILQNPRVAVSVAEFRSQSIAVIGAVTAPGVYAIHKNVSTLTEMLTLAGGPTESAGGIAYVLRTGEGKADPLRIMIDLEDLLDKGNFELNAVLKGGDVIYVPKAPLVYVYGKVRQPGGFALRRSMSVVEAIALAGGFDDKASETCTLTRRQASGKRVVVDLDVRDIEKGRMPNVYLREGDVLYVPESFSLNALSFLWRTVSGIFTFTYRLDDQ